MKHRIRKMLTMVCIFCMISALFTGCGQGSGESSGSESLTVRLQQPLQSTDWQATTNAEGMKITWVQIFEGLYGIDEANGGYYNLLAKDIKVSDDGLTYTITLQDATFQNGDALTADDVVFSYNEAMKNSRFNYVTSMIDKVEAKDEKTVIMTLDYPYSAISHTFWSIKIYSQREFEEVKASGAEFGTAPHTAGTGPYIVTEYDVSSGIKLKAYEDYWQGTPAVKDVEYRLITEDSAAVIAYENGELDYFQNVPLSDWENVEKSANGNSELVKANDILFMAVNYQSPTNNNILGNEKVREAIFYAVNKDNVIKAATNNYGIAAYEYMPSEYVVTSPKVSDGKFKTFDFDKEAAHKALLDAGYSEEEISAGIDVGTILTYGTETSEKGKAAVVIQSSLAECGIKAEVEIGEVSPVTERMYDGDFDIAIYYDSGNYDYNNIRQQVHSESKGMYLICYDDGKGTFDFKKIEDLIDEGVSTADTEERYDIYTELWDIIMNTKTILPLYHSATGIAWSDRIDIGELNPTYYHLTDFSFK